MNIEDFSLMWDDIKELKKELNTLKNTLTLQCVKRVGVKQIATMEGMSVTHIKNHPYYLPRFGVSAYPESHAKWDLEEYERWRQIPINERKEMYAKHLSEIQAGCVGRVKAFLDGRVIYDHTKY